MQSSWEKLTQGQCNNSLPLSTKREKRKQTPTARQVKDAAMRQQHIARANAHAVKVDALALQYDAGGDDRVGVNAERKAMRQTWLNRQMQSGSMYKSKNAKPSACVVVPV